MYSNDIINIYSFTCSPSSKQSPDSLNMPKVTRTTRSSTNSNPNGRVSGNSLENCMASRLVIFSIQTFCHDKPSSNIGVHIGKRGLENGWKVSKVSKVSSCRCSDDPFEASEEIRAVSDYGSLCILFVIVSMNMKKFSGHFPDSGWSENWFETTTEKTDDLGLKTPPQDGVMLTDSQQLSWNLQSLPHIHWELSHQAKCLQTITKKGSRTPEFDNM